MGAARRPAGCRCALGPGPWVHCNGRCAEGQVVVRTFYILLARSTLYATAGGRADGSDAPPTDGPAGGAQRPAAEDARHVTPADRSARPRAPGLHLRTGCRGRERGACWSGPGRWLFEPNKEAAGAGPGGRLPQGRGRTGDAARAGLPAERMWYDGPRGRAEGGGRFASPWRAARRPVARRIPPPLPRPPDTGSTSVGRGCGGGGSGGRGRGGGAGTRAGRSSATAPGKHRPAGRWSGGAAGAVKGG